MHSEAKEVPASEGIACRPAGSGPRRERDVRGVERVALTGALQV